MRDIGYEVLSRMITKQYVYPSFMISYWPENKGYGFDPVGTIPDIINNALVFCWEGVLDLIPALPKAWAQGSIRGVLARDQLQVERLAWDLATGTIDLTLTSDKPQIITLRLPPDYCIDSANRISGVATITDVFNKAYCRQLKFLSPGTCRLQLDVRKGPILRP